VAVVKAFVFALICPESHKEPERNRMPELLLLGFEGVLLFLVLGPELKANNGIKNMS